jgi:hypothetical protein
VSAELPSYEELAALVVKYVLITVHDKRGVEATKRRRRPAALSGSCGARWLGAI